MVRIESEWDFGYEDRIFQSREDAIRSLKDNPNVLEFCEDHATSIDNLINENLIRFQTLLLG